MNSNEHSSKDVKANKEEYVITRKGNDFDDHVAKISEVDITKELIPKFQVKCTNINSFRQRDMNTCNQ